MNTYRIEFGTAVLPEDGLYWHIIDPDEMTVEAQTARQAMDIASEARGHMPPSSIDPQHTYGWVCMWDGVYEATVSELAPETFHSHQGLLSGYIQEQALTRGFDPNESLHGGRLPL